jgi:hypothetical protein
MRRRELITFLAAAAVWPLAVRAQQPDDRLRALQIRILRLQADGAAALIGHFIHEVESQVGWTTQLPWPGNLERRRLDGLRLLRQVPSIAELDLIGKEQLRISRLAMDVVANQTDFSQAPKFTEAVANGVYYGPVYLLRRSEPYMTLSLAGRRPDFGVSVAEVALKLVWDVIAQTRGRRSRGRLCARFKWPGHRSHRHCDQPGPARFFRSCPGAGSPRGRRRCADGDNSSARHQWPGDSSDVCTGRGSEARLAGVRGVADRGSRCACAMTRSFDLEDEAAGIPRSPRQRGGGVAANGAGAAAGDAGGRVPQRWGAEASPRSGAAVRKGLSEAGYVEGQNMTVGYHYLEGQYDRLPALVADLVRRRVAVIAAPGSPPAALAAKAATATIPIVFGVGEDPVQLGLVASLARPGGNATSINFFSQEVMAKRLWLPHELVPKAVRVAVLLNPANASSAESTLRDAKEAAPAIGLQIQRLRFQCDAGHRHPRGLGG